MTINRRQFVQGTLLGGLAGLVPVIGRAQAAERVVVIGGGFAGASVAKYLRLWGDDRIDVTLVDPNPNHVSCVLSNLILTRQLELSDLSFPLSELDSAYGVRVVQGTAVGLDTAARQVQLDNGQQLGFDRAVVAPGIGFMDVPGLDSAKVPHAWIAGSSTLLLRNQLDGLTAGNTVIMTIPAAPYRCPPGPYERACLLADNVQRAGGGRVIVLDANDHIQAERETFERAFSELYGDTLEYYPAAQLEAVDSDGLRVFTSQGEFSGDVVNVIPNQQAGSVVRNSGLTDGRWAPVDPVTYESALQEGIYILGDSQGTSQPKSAHMASSQAKVCADAIIRAASGMPTHHTERLENITTNSACYSPITRDQASWLTANFALDQGTGNMRLSHIGASDGWDRESYRDMFDWADNLFADVFR